MKQLKLHINDKTKIDMEFFSFVTLFDVINHCQKILRMLKDDL